MSDANRSVFSSDVVDSRRTAPPVPLERPVVTGSGEQLGAHWTLTRQDFVGAPEQAEIDAYGPIVTDLMQRRPKNWLGLSDRSYVAAPKSVRPYAYDKIWADVAERRAADPSYMKDVPAKNEAEFTAWVKAQEVSRRRAAQGVIRRESGFGQKAVGFGADVVSSFADPINLATLPIGGGGRTILQAAAREALLNAAVEAVELPTIAGNRAAFGEDFTAGDAAAAVGIAAIGGAVFGGAVKGAGVAGAAAIDSAAGRAAIAAIPGMSSERRAARALLRDTARLAEASDADVARAFARAVPVEARTPEQASAINVIERQVEIDRTNPFVRDRAGMTEHAERLAAAMDALADGAEAPPITRPITAPADVPRAVSRETVLVGIGARDQLKARIGRVENATGNPNARNPNSSATGKYQFVDGTWLRYYKREIGTGGLSDAQILARRSDGVTQDRLMDALLRDNAAGLHAAGEAETAGNLYLAHFAGIGGARKILKASADTPIERVLSAEAIAANSFLRGKSAGDVVAWAHRKMGETAVPAGERPRIDFAGDDAELRLAQQAIDAAAMERAALAQSGDAPQSVTIDDAADLTPWTGAPIEAEPDARTTMVMAADAPRETLSIPERAVDPDVRLAVRDYVADTRGSLKPEKVAAALGLDVERARDALAVLAADPRVGMRQIGTKFRRNPVQRAPLDLITFLARAGGIADNEGHDIARGMGLQKFVPGAGSLVRKGGMSIDAARELAAEAGYFHDRDADGAWSDTTVADFLELLDRARRTKHYRREDLGEAADRQLTQEQQDALDAVEPLFDLHVSERGWDFDQGQTARAVQLVVRDGVSNEEAAVRVINDDLQDVLDEIGLEAEATRYVDLADDFEAVLAGVDRRAGGRGEEPGAERGNAGEGGAGPAEYRGSAADLRREAGLDGPAPPDARRAFDDPDGPDAVALADSLAHDVRVAQYRQLDQLYPMGSVKPGWKVTAPGGERRVTTIDAARREALRFALIDDADASFDPVFGWNGDGPLELGEIRIEPDTGEGVSVAIDPNITARQAQEAALAAKGPLRAKVDQESTIGSPLFDAADQGAFRLDEEGGERGAADILAEIDADEAAIAAARSCL